MELLDSNKAKAIPSWGNMLSDAQEGDVIGGKPWIWMPPVIMITLTILSINFVGEGLKDAFNPRGRSLIIKEALVNSSTSLFYLLRPKPIAFSIFLTVLNETCVFYLYLDLKILSSLSEL